jgi:hypothetical protein
MSSVQRRILKLSSSKTSMKMALNSKIILTTTRRRRMI